VPAQSQSRFLPFLNSHNVSYLTRYWRLGIWSVLALTVTSCAAVRPKPLPPASQLWAILVNGGRRPQENYQSHLLHIRQAVRIVANAGVAPERMAVFMSDGVDPTADVAVRSLNDARGAWRLIGTRAASSLTPPLTFVDSKVDGVEAHPATRAALRQWLSAAPVRAGDTILLYVTDHGSRNPSDPSNNSISLWGENEDLTVQDLRDLIRPLPAGVCVVSVMSQCFSGGFAELDAEASLPASTCGFFSSTAERPAYGCYPENRGRENVGHSFHFLAALSASGSLLAAHNQTLIADDTPDVPLRTSDVFLQSLLVRAAAERGVATEVLIDSMLPEVWSNAVLWEPEIRLLDRISSRFGYASPRSLAELESQTKSLPDSANQLKRVAQAWEAALRDVNHGAYERFLAKTPAWQSRLPTPMSSLPADMLQALSEELGNEIAAYTSMTAPADETRIQLIHSKEMAADGARYRMEVRLAALLRLRTLLTSLAGRQYLATRASAAQRHRYDRLVTCEDLVLPSTPGADTVDLSPDLPRFDDDVRATQAALPSYLGIQFRDLDAERRKSLKLNEGAASVQAVFPDTPAALAGIEPGDIIVGANQRPFSQANEVRLWSMLAPPGKPAQVEVLRRNQRLSLALTPAPYPLHWPKLPGPPQVGTRAPDLRSLPFRGAVPPTLAAGRPHLLFFWATWCTICKAALPEILAYAEQRATAVVAITDEPAETLKRYFNSVGDPFPAIIAIDQDRRDFIAYGVSGSPTFVLVGSDGRIQAHLTGYSKGKGLPLPEWTWTAP